MTTDITGPMIGTTPSTLKFEVPVGETSIVNFDIFNAGIGTLDWDITDSVLWITSASPDSGSSTGRDDITTVELNIDTLGLACGRYDTTVRISSPQADRFYLPVILGVYDRADFREFAVLANYWQADDCNQYPDCNAIDYYVDGTIDIKDLTMLAEYWLGNVQPREPQITDDFETGDFSKLYWQTNGHQPWKIDGIEACGMYSARSGAIEDGQLSILELTVEVIDYDTISFERKVSSESGWDHLSFYIDGELQDRWSGEQDWNTVSFPITDGTHTLKWQYSKDPDCCSSGSDCAWIDNLTIYNATPIPE